MADTKSLVFFPKSPSSMVELNAVCDVFRRNNVCYCIETGVENMHGESAVVLTWFEYKKAVRKGRPVGSGK